MLPLPMSGGLTLEESHPWPHAILALSYSVRPIQTLGTNSNPLRIISVCTYQYLVGGFRLRIGRIRGVVGTLSQGYTQLLNYQEPILWDFFSPRDFI